LRRTVAAQRGVGGRHAVDDGQARIDGGAVARIDPAIHGSGEHDTAAFFEPYKPSR
jgi:hypothetical protein